MLKKIILISLLILAILTAVLFYLNKVFLPTRFKDILVERISKQIGRNVSVGSLHYFPFKGFAIRNITISEQTSSKEEFLTIDEASVGLLVLPLLAQKKIVIPSMVIKNPVLRITKERNSKWNFDDLLPSNKTSEKQKTISAYVASIKIINGIAIFSDKTLARDPIETIKNINISASLSLPKNIKANIRIMPFEKNQLKLIADLNHDLVSNDFLITLNIEKLSLLKFATYINTDSVVFENSFINLAAFDITRRNKKILGKGDIIFGETKIKIQNNAQLVFAPSLSVQQLLVENDILTLNAKLRSDKNSLKINSDKMSWENLTYTFTAKKQNQKNEASGNLTASALLIKKEGSTISSDAINGTASLSYINRALDAKGVFKTQNFNVAIDQDKKLFGNPDIKITLEFNPKEKEPHLKYDGLLSFSSGTLSGIQVIEKIENIVGKINLKKNEISSKSVTALAQGVPVEFSGNLTNFQKPFLDIKGSLPNVNLMNFNKILSKTYPDKQLDLKGNAKIDFHYKGNLHSIENSSIICSALLKNAAIKAKILPIPIVDISGNISYNVKNLLTSHFLPDQATWKNLQATFQEKKYLLNGSLQFNSLEATLSMDALKASTQISFMNDRLKINSLKSQYKDSSLEWQGEILYPQDQKWKVDVAANGNLRLEHLSELIPPFKEKTKNFNPHGLCAVKINFAGDPVDWKNWSLFLKINSDKILLKGYRLNNVLFKFTQRDSYINECSLASVVYDGNFSAQASVDLSKKELPYKLDINFQNINIEKLKDDSTLKNKDISGFATGSYIGVGPLPDIHLSRGEGSLSVKNGELLHLDLLKGLGKLLFVPEYKNITFESAKGNFEIKNEKVFVKDGLLNGNQMELSCNGTVDFNGDLDLDIISRFDKGIIKSSKSFKKAIAAILTQADDFLTVKLTGTIKEPKYYIAPSPLNILRKTKDLILDSIPNIF